LVAPNTDCLKRNGPFLWTEAAVKAFAVIKDKLINAPKLAFLDFDKVFELECDACRVRTVAVLLQERRPITFLSEKSRQKWSLISKNYMRCTAH